MIKRIWILTAVLLFVLFTALSELPEPEPEEGNMILGERQELRAEEVTLYYRAGEALELASVTRTLIVEAGQTIVERALEELFKPVAAEDAISPVPGGAQVKSVRVSGEMVTVDLKMDMASLKSEQELVLLNAAIANTLTGIEGVEAVNILINSRQESVCGLPVGVLGYNEASVALQWAQIQTEADRLSSSTEEKLVRKAALFFPSLDGEWILPEVREIAFSVGDYAGRLLEELAKGPEKSGEVTGLFPSEGEAMFARPMSYYNPLGECVVLADLSNDVLEYAMQAGLQKWHYAAALTETICSFVPGVDALYLYLGDESALSLTIRGEERNLEDVLLRLSDFDAYVGSSADLYFSDGEGGLKRVSRVVSAARADSPRERLLLLLNGPIPGEAAEKVMPDGLTELDILGTARDADKVTVNLSANFYRLSQTLDEKKERTLVYAMVNTLCGIPGVTSVRILFEGESVETLSEGICLMDYLMPNPGLIRE